MTREEVDLIEKLVRAIVEDGDYSDGWVKRMNKILEIKRQLIALGESVDVPEKC